MEETTSLPAEITRYLRAYVQRRRWIALTRAIGTAVAFTIVWLVCWSIVDRIVHLPPVLRWSLLAINIGAIGALLVRPIARLMSSSIDWQTAAEQVEMLESAFGQRLATVVSQRQAPESKCASVWMLDQLTAEVRDTAADRHGGRIVSPAPAIRAWAAAGLSVVIVAALLFWPWLSLRTLLGRLLMPWEDIPSVTTTRLTVEPGNTRIVEQSSLKISAHVDDLIGESVTVHLSSDASTFAPLTMLPTGENRFELDIPSIEHDLRYCVRAGDATSPTYDVRVLRRPVVTEFRIHHTYPGYTKLPPMTVKNTDGLIEALAGTEVVLSVVTDRPLSKGSMVLERRSIDLEPTGDPLVHQAKIKITDDQKYTLDLLSEDDVAGRGPEGTHIRAIPDRNPVAELTLPNELRVHSRDLLPVQYQGTDDYGLASLTILARVNSLPPQPIALRMQSGTRRAAGVHTVDLAELKLTAGDVLQLSLQADDLAGQRGTSPLRQVLIVPRSLDLNWQIRLQELVAALQQAEAIQKDLAGARTAMEEANAIKEKSSQPYLNATARVTRDASAGIEGQAMLKQSLLRSIVRSSSPEFSMSVGWLIDQAQQAQTLAEAVLASRDTATLSMMGESAQRAKEVRDGLAIIVASERAAGMLADRAALLASQRNAPTGDEATRARFANAVERARQDLARDAASVGLDASAGNFEERLRELINRGVDWRNNHPRVDFIGSVREWAGAARTGLGPRLAIAAQAEAVRPDAQVSWARDLELTSRAAAKLESRTESPQEARKEYPPAFESIYRENELLRQPVERQNPRQLAEARTAADEARAKMRRWATDELKPEEAKLAEALEANAQIARGEYDKARQMDRQQNPTTMPAERTEAIEKAMQQAERIDKVASEQAQLAQQSERSTPQQVAELTQRQEQVASELSKADSEAEPKNSGNEQASPEADESATVSAVQQQLAAMTGQLGAVQERSRDEISAAARAEAARALAASSIPGMKAVAGRAAEAEAGNLDRAIQRRAEASKPVSPAAAEEMSSRLARSLPQTSEAVSAVDQQLLPALRALQQGLEKRDPNSRDRAISEATTAIASVQKALASLQERQVERDPMAAARDFAEDAKEALQSNPPDLKSAQQSQQKASAALGKARDQSVRRAARLRLGGVPSMLSIFSPFPFEAEAAAIARGAPVAPTSTGAAAQSRWARFRAHEAQDVSAPSTTPDPPGYEEALKAYFEALGKSK